MKNYILNYRFMVLITKLQIDHFILNTSQLSQNYILNINHNTKLQSLF